MQQVMPVMGKIALKPFHFLSVDANTAVHCEGSDLVRVREMCKESYHENFAKLSFDDGAIKIPESDVTIEKVKEYSDDYEVSSKTVTTYLRTYCHKTQREIKSKVRTVLNPLYELNPECGLCYKKVTKVFDDQLLNEEKTPKKVCAACRKDLKRMRKIVLEMKAK